MLLPYSVCWIKVAEKSGVRIKTATVVTHCGKMNWYTVYWRCGSDTTNKSSKKTSIDSKMNSSLILRSMQFSENATKWWLLDWIPSRLTAHFHPTRGTHGLVIWGNGFLVTEISRSLPLEGDHQSEYPCFAITNTKLVWCTEVHVPVNLQRRKFPVECPSPKNMLNMPNKRCIGRQFDCSFELTIFVCFVGIALVYTPCGHVSDLSIDLVLVQKKFEQGWRDLGVDWTHPTPGHLR